MWIGVDISQTEEEDTEIPDRLVQYLARMLDCVITDNGDDFCMVYLKLPRFIFIAPLTPYDESQMVNTRVSNKCGHFYVTNAGIMDSAIGQFILGRPLALEKAMDQISEAQRQKMRQTGVDNLEKYKYRDLGDILDYIDNNKQ